MKDKLKINTTRVTVLSGVSIDGKLNFHKDSSSKGFDMDLPEEVYEPLATLREESDAVLVGINTVIADNPHLLSKNNPGLKQIVLDSTCKIDLHANLVEDPRCNLTLITTNQTSKDKLNQLEQAGVEVLICGEDSIDLNLMLDKLSELNIHNIMVEGGGKIIYSFLQNGLVDEIHLMIFPFIVGNETAVSFVSGKGFDSRLNLELIDSKVISNNYILNTYKPIYE